MRDFGFAIAQIDHTAVDFRYLQDFLAMKPIIKEEKATSIDLKHTPKIEVKDVFFRYPKLEDDDHERPMVLKGTTLTIEPGAKVAFVGLNGSGKTTLCQLLANVYHPTDGHILIDGKPLSLIKQDSWHEHLFHLPQNPRIPELLLEQAMTGDKEGEVDMPRLQKALQYAFADTLVDSLDEKLKTWLGRQWPGGRDFSTGQYQRLCITLVFYRLLHPKTRIAIFDEPMANCDYETRDRFYPAVTGSPDFADKTIITISHDKEYMHYFSRIIGFEDGKVRRDLKDQVLPQGTQPIPFRPKEK
jgi:ATP-binding cassette subfamily B protein